jgi:hypothetical protein
MKVGARRMGHSISEFVPSINIPLSTVSHVFREYLVEGISTHRGQHSGQPRVLNDRDQRRPARIDRGNRQATLASMGCGSRRQTRAPLLTPRHRTQRLTWACDVANWILEDW